MRPSAVNRMAARLNKGKRRQLGVRDPYQKKYRKIRNKLDFIDNNLQKFSSKTLDLIRFKCLPSMHKHLLMHYDKNRLAALNINLALELLSRGRDITKLNWLLLIKPHYLSTTDQGILESLLILYRGKTSSIEHTLSCHTMATHLRDFVYDNSTMVPEQPAF